MRRFFVCAAAVAASASAFAQFFTGFESPEYNSSAGGTLLTGQNGWHIPPTSVDFNVFNYSGNTLGVASNPTGGGNFAAGVSAGTTLARSQHNSDFSTADEWSFATDMLGMYTGTLPSAQNLGSFSSQLFDGTTYNLAHRSFIALMVWDDIATAASWSVQYNVFDSAGVALLNQSPGAAWAGLTPNHWYRQVTRVNFATNQIVSVSITDLTTMTTTTASPGWFLNGGSSGGGFARPNGVRIFAGGATGNVAAFDNVVVPEPATMAALGLGVLAVMRRRSRRSS